MLNVCYGFTFLRIWNIAFEFYRIYILKIELPTIYRARFVTGDKGWSHSVPAK
jgi:hypothetical protein